MRVVGWFAALLLVSASAVPASAMNWSIGANLGANINIPADTDVNGDGIKDDLQNVVDFSWPQNVLTPGLRIGFVGDNPQHEFFIDTGLFIASAKNFSSSNFSASANYQYNFSSTASVAPYVTGGAGVVFDRSKDETGTITVETSATAGIFGGGLGIRHKMGNGHGTMRAEVRFDRVTEGKDGVVPIIIESNIIGFKLGFDLWDK